MTTSPTLDRPTDRPRQAAADLSGNQHAGAARFIRLDRAGLAALLAGTALLYLWGLGESGWANSF